MNRVFFDTWGWLAIAHRHDRHHEEVMVYYRRFLQSGGVPVTTDYVLSETITLLRARTGTEGATRFVEALLGAAGSGRVQLERITPHRWEHAWRICRKYHDHPDMSFVDFTSFAVMKELRLRQALTGDRHFETVGMGFERLHGE